MSSKLGPHCLRPTADAIALVRAGAPVAKLVDDFGAAAEMLAANPKVIIIGRRITTYPEDPGRVVTAENLRHIDPVAAAVKWIGFQKQTYDLNPLIRYWEGPNEPAWEVKLVDGSIDVPATVANYAWYGIFEARRTFLLNELGLKSVVGNFSFGTPDIDDGKLYAWTPMLPTLLAARDFGGMLGLHEYSDEHLDKFVEANGEGWYIRRYRKVYRLVFIPNGLTSLPIVLTELGLDFKRTTDIDYPTELIELDKEMQQDRYLLGGTLFTFGSTSSAWDNFNLEGTPEAQKLIKYTADNRDAPPVEPPTQEPKMGIDISQLDYDKLYTWDALPTAPERGNTIFIPTGMTFAYVWDKKARVKFPDIKPGSPTLGQMRTSDNDLLKPEVVIRHQAQMPDIPFPAGQTALIKCFKGYGPIWVKFGLSLNLTVGATYRLTWPVLPNLLTSDDNGLKVYADDPAAGWLRLQVKPGVVEPIIDPSIPLDNTWYNGLDFPFGHWFSPQVVIVATQPTMTVMLEGVSPFGLKDSDYMVAKPSLELVTGVDPTVPPVVTVPPIGGSTLHALAATAKSAVDALSQLIG